MKRVCLPDHLYKWAAACAEYKEIRSGSDNGVATITRMAVKAYLSRHFPQGKPEGTNNGDLRGVDGESGT